MQSDYRLCEEGDSTVRNHAGAKWTDASGFDRFRKDKGKWRKQFVRFC